MRHSETVTLGGGGLDRAAHLRAQALEAWPGARVLVVWRGRVLAGADGLVYLAPDDPLVTPEEQIFLGRDPSGQAYFAAPLACTPEEGPEPLRVPGAPDGAALHDLRAIMGMLTPWDAELAATARALTSWHHKHGFCAACGARSALTDGGWRRDCPACGAQHFPRTDPVVIMLVTHGDRVLMGRGAQWPEGRFSLLAGFVEPGETVEAAVRREVSEEVGVRCGPVRYLASQPWPFPASLMVGMATEAQDTAFTLDPAEIAEARWVTRAELATVFAGEHPQMRPPFREAIAGFLLWNWLADRLDLRA